MERVVTVGVRQQSQSARQFAALMEELRRLVETAGGTVEEQFFQNRDRLDPATLVGSGKILELADSVRASGVKTVVFDDELTPAQQKNIEKMIPAKIVDRTRLILDIFSQRAHTKEGQLQVELAQLNYLVPRLTGAWRGFSQQMGGIGMRGPGERKIEVERRYVRERIKRLKKEIEDIRHHRDRARVGRRLTPIPQIALVGYTNVGKSTILNKLVGEGVVYADDKLFATLDPTTRRVKLPDGRAVLFTDTVGFIQKLPHDLVAAFRATLEEVGEANLLVHVVDGASDDRVQQQQTVNDVIKSLGADKIPMITIYNKADRLPAGEVESLARKGTLAISARTGNGIREFLKAIEEKLDEDLMEVTLDLPHSHQRLMSDIYRTAHIVSQKSTKTGTRLKIRIDPGNWSRLSKELENGNGASRS